MGGFSAAGIVLAGAGIIAMTGCRTGSAGPSPEELQEQWNIARSNFKPSQVTFAFHRDPVGMVCMYDKVTVDRGPIYLCKGSIDAEPVNGRRFGTFLRATGTPWPTGIVENEEAAKATIGLARAYAAWAGKELITDGELDADYPAWSPQPVWSSNRADPEWCLHAEWAWKPAVPALVFVDQEKGQIFRSPGPLSADGSIPGDPRAAFRCWTKEVPLFERWPPHGGELASVRQSDPSCPPSFPVVK